MVYDNGESHNYSAESTIAKLTVHHPVRVCMHVSARLRVCARVRVHVRPPVCVCLCVPVRMPAFIRMCAGHEHAPACVSVREHVRALHA